MNDIFDTDSCEKYLHFRLNGAGKARGIKTQFARALECDGAYVSRVLDGAALLSLEQGMRANRFFGHTVEESEFFLIQIGIARAGSKELREYYKKKLDSLREHQRTLSKRIKGAEKLPELTQATYYSLWLYAAIDVATSIPSLQTPEALAEYFRVSRESVAEALSFLQDCGMVEKKDGRWVHTQRQIFLPSDSPHIRKHHLNWRLKAMQLIEESAQKNFHYSSVVSMSKHDLDKFKEMLIQTVGKARELIKSSKEEIVVGYNIDCFEL